MKFRSTRPAVLLALSAIILLAWPSLAAPATSTLLEAVKDTVTDINQPEGNFNNQMLLVESTMGAPGQPDVHTRVLFLGFDLGSVDFEIRSAALYLDALSCGGQLPLDPAGVDVYGVDNGPGNAWTEAGLTWNNQPGADTSVLISAAAGTAGEMTWNDGAAGAFASWLETQRTANDGSATLVLKIDTDTGGGIRDVFFEDREGSAAGFGCPDPAGPPRLLLDSEITSIRVLLPIVTRP